MWTWSLHGASSQGTCNPRSGRAVLLLSGAIARTALPIPPMQGSLSLKSDRNGDGLLTIGNHNGPAKYCGFDEGDAGWLKSAWKVWRCGCQTNSVRSCPMLVLTLAGHRPINTSSVWQVGYLQAPSSSC